MLKPSRSSLYIPGSLFVLAMVTLVAFTLPAIAPRPVSMAPIGPYLNGTLPESTPDDTNPAPTLLSEIDAFSDLNNLETVPGLVPYELIVPFWSDGALKQRWMAIPNDGAHNTAEEQILFAERDTWAYPVGTVFVKHFEMPIDETDGSVTRRLETRFMVHGADRLYYALTYRWNAAGTDAILVPPEGQTETLTINTATGTRTQNWYYPSTVDCFYCHNDAARYVLGPSTHQFNREITYPGTSQPSNQLVALSANGLLDTPITSQDTEAFLQAAATHDFGRSLEDRARSYIDANCGYCHVPGGVGRAVFDARYRTRLQDQGLIEGFILEKLGIQNPQVIAPGDTARSVVYYRMARVDTSVAMPPRAKNRVDEEGLTLIAQWIESLVLSVNSFSPSSGPAGTTLVLRGNQLKEVTSVQLGALNIEDFFFIQADSSLQFVIPEGAGSGAITLSNGSETVTTPRRFTVTPAGFQANYIFDGNFEVEPLVPPGGTLRYESNSTIGAWAVTSGNVDIKHVAADSLGNGLPAGSGEHVIDLHGDTAGRLSQLVRDMPIDTRFVLKFFYAVSPNLNGAAEANVRLGSTLNANWIARNPGDESWLPAVYAFDVLAPDDALLIEGTNSVIPQSGMLIDRVTLSPCPDCGPAPSISTLSKSSATPGNEIILTGINLDNPLAVSFNGYISPRITAVSETQLKARVPDAETTGPIRVTTEDGTAESIPFTILRTSGTSTEDLTVPERFALLQNYPNPFNPETALEFDVPSMSHVRVDLYDMQGRLLRTLANQVFPPGSHVLRFQAAGLPSGHYLYRLQAGEVQLTRVMQVLK